MSVLGLHASRKTALQAKGTRTKCGCRFSPESHRHFFGNRHSKEPTVSSPYSLGLAVLAMPGATVPVMACSPTSIRCEQAAPWLDTKAMVARMKAKLRNFSVDAGPTSFHITAKSEKSLSSRDDAAASELRKLRESRFTLEGRQEISSQISLGLGAFAERATRRDQLAPVFQKKTHSNAFGLEARLAVADTWSLEGGWQVQDGWGKRSIADDVVRLSSGEHPASVGLSLAIRFPLWPATGLDDAGPAFSLKGNDGSTAGGVGAGMRHATAVSLHFATRF
jgi:hypothetical protein